MSVMVLDETFYKCVPNSNFYSCLLIRSYVNRILIKALLRDTIAFTDRNNTHDNLATIYSIRVEFSTNTE